MSERPRVIIALSDRAEASAVADWLASDGYEPVRRAGSQTVIEEMRTRVYDLLIADAGVDGRPALRPEGRARRPLTPALLIGNAPAQRGDAVTSLAMYIARPVDRAMLNCYASMAILEGSPVRRSERKLVDPLEAVVNGVPSHIVDVSAEGLRIQMAPEKRAVLPPYFTVRVPMLGVRVNVRRVWTRGSAASQSLWYGGSLLPNRASAMQGWLSLIETIPSSSKPKAR